MRSRSSRRRNTRPRRCPSICTAPPGRTSSGANPGRPPRFAAAAVIGLLVVAAGLRLWGVNFGLPALYRPDEDVTVGRAMGIFHGILDPHFADWPHLYFYVAAAWLAPFRLIGVVHAPASGYLWVRILDALLGSVTVLLVFEFGRRAYGWLAGFFGASALAVAFLHVRDSHFATLDVPLTLACTAALYIAYRTIHSRGLRPLLLNGIALGVAASLKYNGALVFSGIAAAQALRARAARSRWTPLLARLALIGAGRSVFFRYADPLIPLLLLLGGRALAALVERTARPQTRRLALASALVLIVVAPIVHDVRYDTLIQQTDTRTLAFDWLAQHVPTGGRAAVPYMARPAHDQAMIDSGGHSHGATHPYVASFLHSRLETRYSIRELTRQDLQLTSLDSFRSEGIDYIVVGYETPGTGCRTDSPLERALQAHAPAVARFPPPDSCPARGFCPHRTPPAP